MSSSREFDLEQAYAKYAHSVLRRARALLGSEEDAREMVQEIFLCLLEAPEQYGGRSSLATWLYSATTHRCLNRIRDHKVRSRLLGVHANAMQGVHSGVKADDASALRRLLSELPEELAAVAVYYYLDEMTQDEVAVAMGRSRRHVANLLQRLRQVTDAQEAT